MLYPVSIYITESLNFKTVKLLNKIRRQLWRMQHGTCWAWHCILSFWVHVNLFYRIVLPVWAFESPALWCCKRHLVSRDNIGSIPHSRERAYGPTDNTGCSIKNIRFIFSSFVHLYVDQEQW